MLLENKKTNINFFKSEPILPKENSKIFQLFHNLLTVFMKILSSFRFIHFIGFVASTLCFLLVINYMQGSEARQKLKMQELNFTQQQIIHKQKLAHDAASLLALEAKKQEDIAKNILQTKIATIKNMSPNHFNKILAHLEALRLKEVDKLLELYWTVEYINKKDTPLDMDFSSKKIRSTIQTVNNFYYKRKNEMNQAFNAIKNNQIELIEITHDNQNSVEKIIVWDNLTSIQSFLLMDETNSILAIGWQYLKTPEGLVKFLKENKQLIADSRSMLE